MNKSIALLTCLLLALAACGGSEIPDESAEPSPVSSAVPPEVPATLPPPVISDINSETEATDAASAPDIAVGETPQPAPEVAGPISPWPLADFGYGIQVHGNATVGDPASTMSTIRNQLGLDWVKIQLQWWLVKPSPDADQWFFYDGVIDEAVANNLRVLVSVVGAPEWTRAAGTRNGPPDDFGLYADFLTETLQRYSGKIQAVEVWNEQNLDREWTTANGISPEDYVEFLRNAYEAIKAVDANLIVISGALSPTGPGDWVKWADDFDYMDRALAAGMLSYADCVGAHHNGYNIAPDVAFEDAGSTAEAATAFFRGPFENPFHVWSFKTTLDTYAEKVQSVDPEMKLCVTEFGWASSEGYDVYPEGFGFAVDNTLQEQAEYIVQGFRQMYESGDVWLAFLFNFDFGNKGGGPADDPVPYSIVDTTGVPRPAFNALAAMEKPR